ncbi:hypothetical protein LEP1GSC173_1373 [Leptospira interrogans str. HAI1594]|uniref:Uncharacterized protein n=1 Tax=Leptospira interrogans serovar Icterohaemorrhagiae str. Verdun HP TaxID=1049910 RepID=M6RQ83_LEPIR|nr:hypothetical protein LEP1GSC117_3451 [Leptospira interrogans serovar Icterohaemorrhagiae str. Verdun LP]EKP75972.1 hypothetical protein LEP1GSC173_1373 [Leptospira interrogans str. HAI1594]EMO03023.1 hypothetical protein LEP1GSC116_0094 [Leptospira interrogans serovar Icterohaemorrhagiae str. Verdun HP]EMO19317.1 hypothetical protein LEP1GSC167_2242 [Leptospira interrogans serovar Copenhageni str. HAI0188]EMO35191.1 hypothetical protein LEP1GSC177_0712 [Leptospira interrogans str. MMD3731]E
MRKAFLKVVVLTILEFVRKSWFVVVPTFEKSIYIFRFRFFLES